MKKIKFEIPKPKYKFHELPSFVVDELNKNFVYSFFSLITGIFLSIKSKELFYLIICTILSLGLILSFYFLFFRFFSYDIVTIFEGYIYKDDDENQNASKVAKKIVNHYVRKLYTLEVESGENLYILKTFIKNVKVRNGMKVRIYINPNETLKNKDGSYTVTTIYAEVLSLKKGERNKKREA